MRSKLFAMTAVLLVGVGTVLAAEEAALPDYNAEPFRVYTEFTHVLDEHPEWGEMSGVLYTDYPGEKPGAQGVYVLSDENGNLRLADWVVVRDDWSHYIRRYLYRDGAWHFEKVLD